MILAFDLDDVICFRDKKYESFGFEKYKYCEPNYKIIKIINECYARGDYIKIYTARGMSYFNNDLESILQHIKPITENSLKEWNVLYHELIFGKIHYDILIDDKAINSLLVNNIDDIKI